MYWRLAAVIVGAVIRIATFLASIALVMTALLPSGYMAAQAEDGSLILRICDGKSMNSAPAQVMDHGDHHDMSGPMPHHSAGDEDHVEHGDEQSCEVGTAPVGNIGDEPDIASRLIQAVALPAVTLTILTGIFPTGLPPATGRHFPEDRIARC